MAMIKAQAGVKNNLRRLNKSIIQNGSNHIVQVSTTDVMPNIVVGKKKKTFTILCSL